MENPGMPRSEPSELPGLGKPRDLSHGKRPAHPGAAQPPPGWIPGGIPGVWDPREGLGFVGIPADPGPRRPLGNSGMSRNDGIPESRDFGMAENRGILGSRNSGILESRNYGFTEFWNFRIVGFWDRGIPELWNHGITDLWNSGISESWNSGIILSGKAPELPLERPFPIPFSREFRHFSGKRFQPGRRSSRSGEEKAERGKIPRPIPQIPTLGSTLIPRT